MLTTTDVKLPFSKDVLRIPDVEALIDRITEKLKQDISGVLQRKGAVVGISGGIDSSVTLALSVKALGADRVLGVIMPEKDSSAESEKLATLLAGQLGV